MKCMCCQSDRFSASPFFLRGYFKCRRCGLVFKEFSDHRKLHADMARHYREHDPHDRIAESKAYFFHSVLEFIFSRLKGRKIDLLDVGCGHGYFLETAAAAGVEAYGVEFETDSARSARRKLGAQRIFNGEFKQAEYSDESFDVITLWDVLFLLEDPFEALRKCHRLLKKGGLLGIRVRNVEFQKVMYLAYAVLKKAAARPPLKKPYVFHPFCFGRRSIAALLARSGFSNIDIRNSPLSTGDPYRYASGRRMVPMLKRSIERTAESVFRLSNRKWLFGPSLLVWAEKGRPQDG